MVKDYVEVCLHLDIWHIPVILNIKGLGVTLGVNIWIYFPSAYEFSFNARCQQKYNGQTCISHQNMWL
jgi:hypothetical protein